MHEHLLGRRRGEQLADKENRTTRRFTGFHNGVIGQHILAVEKPVIPVPAIAQEQGRPDAQRPVMHPNGVFGLNGDVYVQPERRNPLRYNEQLGHPVIEAPAARPELPGSDSSINAH